MTSTETPHPNLSQIFKLLAVYAELAREYYQLDASLMERSDRRSESFQTEMEKRDSIGMSMDTALEPLQRLNAKQLHKDAKFIAFLENTHTAKSRFHHLRPPAFIPDDIGVKVPLPTGPERLEQIEQRLNAAIMIPLGNGETGWQVYEQPTISTGGMEKVYEELGEEKTSYTPPSELTIHTAYRDGMLKGPAPIVSRMGGPFQYPNDLSSLKRKDAALIAHAPADMAYLLKEVHRQQCKLQRLAEVIKTIHTQAKIQDGADENPFTKGLLSAVEDIEAAMTMPESDG